MNPNRALLLTFVLIAASAAFGIHSHLVTQTLITCDLNRALEQTAMQQQQVWLSKSTMENYTRLQETMGPSVNMKVGNRAFADALSIPKIKSASGISFCVLKPGANLENSMEKLNGYVVSDTLCWCTADANAGQLIVAVRGYARCSTADIFRLSNQKASGALLTLAILWMVGSTLYLRRRKQTAPLLAPAYDTLPLTPMQYALMELFYQKESHRLSKTEICQALWPGKENADETLYTLIRRLKLVLEQHSNLQITTDRGRAYELKIRE